MVENEWNFNRFLYRFQSFLKLVKNLLQDGYLELLWTTLAEFPGLIVTLFILEYFGRRITLGHGQKSVIFTC